MSAEQTYFSKGLAIPAYDICAKTVCWRFRAECYRTPYDAWYLSLPEGEHRFRVAPIDEVMARAL